MSNIVNEIRQTARMLLAEGKADVVIGFERGTLPLRATPCFIKDAGDAERLIWDETCNNNLAVFVKDIPGKKAVVVKGCDSRTIALLLNENQLKRDELFLIGVS
jgi:coenzyme F420-reducing hydrogenase beta subunit